MNINKAGEIENLICVSNIQEILQFLIDNLSNNMPFPRHLSSKCYPAYNPPISLQCNKNDSTVNKNVSSIIDAFSTLLTALNVSKKDSIIQNIWSKKYTKNSEIIESIINELMNINI